MDDKRRGKDMLAAEAERASIVATVAGTATGVVFKHENGIVLWVVNTRDGRGVETVGISLRGDVVCRGVNEEPRVVEAEVLEGGRFEGNSSPVCEILVSDGLGVSNEGTNSVESSGVLRIDGNDTLLDDVHNDDRCLYVSGSDRIRFCQSSYPLSVECCVV
jgi:hypothetical protein